MIEYRFQEVMRQWKRMCACKQANKECYKNGCILFKSNGCEAIYDAKNMNIDYEYIEQKVMQWAKENPEPVYETWYEYLQKIIPHGTRESELGFMALAMRERIRPDIAEKLGLKPKGIDNGT